MPRNTVKGLPAARRFASVQAAATMYDVDPITVRRWISSGLINGYRIGDRLIKVDLDEIDARVVRQIPNADEREAAPARTGR
jgi:hypothetical protein